METTQQPAGAPPPVPAQVIPPLSQAWEHMKAQLFPFDLRKWFLLGFVAWLMMLGGGPNFNFNFTRSFNRGFGQGMQPGGVPGPDAEFYDMADKALKFFDAHSGIIIPCAIAAFLVMFAVLTVMAYFSSRGLFMYMDCIVRRVAEVKEPWRRSRVHGKQLFFFRLVCNIIVWLTLLIAGAMVLMSVLPAIRSHSLGIEHLMPVIVAAAVIVPIFLVIAFASYVAGQLLAPIMYMRGMRMTEAWQELRRIGRGNFWTFVLFGCMQTVTFMAYGMLTLPVVCCTCLLGALPVIHHTIMQPVIMWMRAYPLYFLAQFGPEYAMPLWPGDERAAPAASAAPVPPADLVAACGQCGQQHQIPGGVKGTYVCTRCGGKFDVA